MESATSDMEDTFAHMEDEKANIEHASELIVNATSHIAPPQHAQRLKLPTLKTQNPT